MVITHFAVGFALRPAAPRVPLALLMGMGFFADIVFAVLFLLGIERAELSPGATEAFPFELEHLPYSHSLVALTAWATLLGLGWGLWRKDGRGAVMIGVATLLHWPLDAISHAPDMAVGLFGPKVGLGLWSSLPATLLVEGGLTLACAVFYARLTEPTVRAARPALIGFTAFMLLAMFAAYLGPPPPSPGPFAVLMLLSLPPLLAVHWIDRRRALRSATPETARLS